MARRGYRQALVLDNDNFVLQREPDGPSNGRADGGGAARLNLVFPPPLRFDEAVPPSAGEPLAGSFIATAEVQEGVVVARREGGSTLIARAKSLLRREGGLAFRDLVDVVLETRAVAWSYALVLGLDPDAASGVVTVEVGVEVMDGKLGIALAGADRSRFCAPERTLGAMPLRQRIVVAAKSADLRYLVFRNAAPDGVRTRFKVVSIEARRRS